METCPHCKGETGWFVILSIGDYCMECGELETNRRWETCWTCNGTGQISLLKAAVYRARGGPAPINRMGF